MKKMLMISSVVSMIDQFNMSNIEILKKLGYEVHVASNFETGSTSSKKRVEEFKKELTEMNIPYFQVDFSRSIGNISSNIHVYKQIKRLIKENNYNFIHCHSPIGGVVGRIAAHNTNTPVIYTAHGFHFFKGGPLKNWMFYPMEKFLANYTDVLITINHEDYYRAKKYFKAKKIEYIPGVGVDTKKYENMVIDKEAVRERIGIPKNAIMLFSVGELCKRKNHETTIRAFAKVNNKNLYYIICGKGELDEYLKNLCKELSVEERVKLLGYRTDISELCKASDIYLFPSTREGLGLAAIEGMSSGLPLISSYINGIKDYTENGKTGFCLDPFDIDGFSNAIETLAKSSELRATIGKYNQEVVRNFDIEKVEEIMNRIYNEI